MPEPTKPSTPETKPTPSLAAPIIGSITYGLTVKRWDGARDGGSSAEKKIDVTVLLPEGCSAAGALAAAAAVLTQAFGKGLVDDALKFIVEGPGQATVTPKAQTATPTAPTYNDRSTTQSPPAAPSGGPTTSTAHAAPATPAHPSSSSAGGDQYRLTNQPRPTGPGGVPTFLPGLQRATCGNPNRPGCGAEIWWGKTTPKGELKNHPYDADGTSHFRTCPQRNNFSQQRR